MDIVRFSYNSMPREMGLFTAFRLGQLEQMRMAAEGPREDKQDKGPTAPQPEIVPPKEGGDKPDITPEVPEMPKIPESEVPAGGREIGPSGGDVVESPVLPDMPETGVPARDLPGGILH